ncbi:DnaJ-domain-containing protein [Cenococcum geophilum]
MASLLPPDPYAALGVSRNADEATIKSTYRKLALKCHPDKVPEESLKKQKQEEFHKIQTAYEIIGDADKRATYDAEVRLAELRREKLERGGSGPRVEIRTAGYDIRTAAPSGATFATRGPPRYEDRRPNKSYDDDKYYEDRSSSRKYEAYEAYSKRSSPRTARTEKEPVKVTSRTSDRSRSEQKKTREKDERRDRQGKYAFVAEEDSADEKARYEAGYRKREEAKLREERYAAEDEVRRQAADARRRADDARRQTEEIRRQYVDERQRKLDEQQSGVKSYIERARALADADPRPQASRTNSSRDPRDYYDRSRRERPEPVRRSSARPKDREPRPGSSGRDSHRERKYSSPEIVEWDSERRIPSFKHSASSPAEIKVPRTTPQRAHTMEAKYDHRRTETSPTPGFRRAETAPIAQTASPTTTRRKEATPVRPSTLRASETVLPNDSGYSSPGTPETMFQSAQPAQPTTTKTYHYGSGPQGGVGGRSAEDIRIANGHRTVLHEPGTHRRTRSPSPIRDHDRHPLSTARTVPAPTSGARYTTVRPTISRSATMNVSPERRPSLDTKERGRSRELYGEVGSDFLRRERSRQPTSYNPDQINWQRKIGPEDISWSSRGRERVIPERERDYAKPTLRRGETFAY